MLAGGLTMKYCKILRCFLPVTHVHMLLYVCKYHSTDCNGYHAMFPHNDEQIASKHRSSVLC